MAAMGTKRFLNLVLWSLLGCAAVTLIAAAPARAQFYNLDGAYRCLDNSSASCAKAVENLPPLPPPQPPAPPLEEAISRIVAMKASAADLAEIEKQAEAKEPRAVEALAWCKLNGVGGMVDPVEAFRLYGEADRLGIPTARSNQIAIFENRLTSEQRQFVLMREQTP